MICYLCRDTIGEDQPFYNDYGHYVCKPCFLDAPRCFVCRFPGKVMETVAGLGPECEFCQGKIIAEGTDLTPLVEPLRNFLKAYRLRVPAQPRWVWSSRDALRALQTQADLPQEDFIDDFLRFAYPIYYHEGAFHLLRRMTKETFVAYGVVAFAAGELASQHALPNLNGQSPFHIFTRGWCHWLGYQASQLLGYDLERRQLRKWPELGLMGEFERWERMARLNKPPKMLAYFQAHLKSLAAKYLDGPADRPTP